MAAGRRSRRRPALGTTGLSLNDSERATTPRNGALSSIICLICAVDNRSRPGPFASAQLYTGSTCCVEHAHLNCAYLLLAVVFVACLPRGWLWLLLGWSGLSGSLRLLAHQTSTSALLDIAPLSPLAAAAACRVPRQRRRVVVPAAAARRPNQLQQSSQRQVPRAAAAASAAEEGGMRTLLVVGRRRLLPLLKGSGLGSIVPCRE